VLIGLGCIVGASIGARQMSRSMNAYARMKPLWALGIAALGAWMVLQGFHIAHRPVFHFLDNWAAAILVGVLVGFVGRISELGGVLSVPAIVFLLGQLPLSAQGTALVILALSSFPATAVYATRRQVSSPAVLWLSLGAVFGALVGSRYAISLPETALLFLYGVVLVLLGLGLLARPGAQPRAGDSGD
jgi:uncharacterized membrane protein YfcA